MVKKPYLAKSNGIDFRNFGHKQGIQVHKRNPCTITVCPNANFFKESKAMFF